MSIAGVCMRAHTCTCMSAWVSMCARVCSVKQCLLGPARLGSVLPAVPALVGPGSEGGWERLSRVEGACPASGLTHLASSLSGILPSGVLVVPLASSSASLHPQPGLTLRPCSGPQVNIDHFTKDLTVKSLVEPSLSSFDIAQKKVRALMEKDSLPRFLRSEFYQELVK